MRGFFEQLWLVTRFFGDPAHRIHERVQDFLTLGLGWFDHQGFVNDEWEVIRGRVEVVIHQSLSNIQRVYIRRAW